MHLQTGLIFTILHVCSTVVASPVEQQPIQEAGSKEIQEVRHVLREAEIIPTVIDDFIPYISLAITWPQKSNPLENKPKKDISARLGNTLEPEDLQDQPAIAIYDETDAGGESGPTKNMTYVITLTDPDAPSRKDPKWSEMCHWIASNITLSGKPASSLTSSSFGSYLWAHLTSLFSPSSSSNTHDEGDDESDDEEKNIPDVLIEYKPPGPPPKTGPHRYIFLLFAPRNGTSLPLHLTKPGERKHWGTGKKGGGVREWARSNGLVPVGANFIYAMNEEQ